MRKVNHVKIEIKKELEKERRKREENVVENGEKFIKTNQRTNGNF